MAHLGLRGALVPFIFAACSGALSQDPVHRHFTIADGLPSNTVYAALQDREGFMWFATDAGAVRFDGVDFRIFSIEQGATDLDVINLAEDSKGRIWFLTLNGKLCYYHKGRVFNDRDHPEFARFTSRSGWQSFLEDGQGRLWFGSVRFEVLRLDLSGDADRLWSWDSGQMSVLSDGGGGVLLERSNSLYANRGDQWVELSRNYSDFPNPFVHPSPDRAHPSVKLNTNGIDELHNSSWVHARTVTPDLDPAFHITCWWDRAGDIWVRRLDGGIDLLGSGAEAPRRLFARSRINYVHLDREGNRWFCTSRNGIFLTTRKQWRAALIATSADGSRPGVISLFCDSRGTLWIGTEEGGISTIAHARAGQMLGARRLGRVMEMDEGPDGKVYAATDEATIRIDPSNGTLTSMIIEEGIGERKRRLSEFGSKALDLAPDGTLWVAYFGLKRSTREDELVLQSPLGLNLNERVPFVHVDPTGKVWFASSTALYSWENGKTTVYPELIQGMGLRATDMADWAIDTVAISTLGAGIQLVSKGRSAGSITMKDGLVSNDIKRLRIIGDTIYAATARGLAMGFRTSPTRVSWSVIGPSHGLPTHEVNDAWPRPEGIYVATDLGLCLIPRHAASEQREALQVHFVSIMADGRPVDESGSIEVKEKEGRLSVRFNAVTFAEPDSVQYEYRLQESHGWTRIPNGTLELASLSAGAYALSVRAQYPGGPWSKPLNRPFTVEAAWFNKAPARILLLLSAILGIAYYTRMRTRKRYRRVIAKLRERQLVNEERGRIAADIHDDLGADLSRLLHYARRAEPDGASDRPITTGLDRAIDKMDEIIWALDPKRDTLQSTIQFIELQAKEAAEQCGLLFRADVQVPDQPVHLDASRRREIMLIAREAIRNITEHAKATTIWVEWRSAYGEVELVIRDDGQGIGALPDGNGRHGLGNMRMRAEKLGGQLSIARNDPRGTRVSLRFLLAGITRSDEAQAHTKPHIGP